MSTSQQEQRTAVITGATSGIGYETALALAAQGITVVMACRHPGRMHAAVESIRALHPNANINQVTLDLGSLTSVRGAAQQISATYHHIDILINNAGIMNTPRWNTLDGFEAQFGVNHLGHYAFTLSLIGSLLKAPDARVVTVSSMAHRWARTDIEQWPHPRDYHPARAYAASKLANMLFAFELDRRLQQSRRPVMSLACHPGWSSTNLPYVGLRAAGRRAAVAGLRLLAPLVTQSAAKGALPSLYAATSSDVNSGCYVGPTRLGHTRGPAGTDHPAAAAADPVLASRLWEMSEDLTGLRNPALVSVLSSGA